MKYGIIIWNVADLWAEPKFQSERRSQLLYNECITITQKRSGYLRVYQKDGYSGWADDRAIRIVSKNAWIKYKRKLNRIITAGTAVVKTDIRQPSDIPPFLFYGTRLAAGHKEGNFSVIESISGAKLKIAINSLERCGIISNIAVAVKTIFKDARRFMGVPYLWGGSTPFGFDCSGMVQALFARVGVALPRDSKDQRKAGYRIDRTDIKPGDLLFFPGHVVIALGQDKIIHSSLAEGGVAINSLNSDSDRFRGDLYDSFLEARRVIQ